MQEGLKKSTITSLFWKLFEQGGAAFITLVVQIVLARILAPEQFGMLAIMLVFVNVGNVIVQSGLNTAIIQTPTLNDDDCSTAFWMSFGISCALYVAIFFAAPAIAGFYAMPEAVAPLRVLVLVLLVNAYNSIQEALVARNFVFRKTFIATVTAGLVSGGIGIGMAFFGCGIWALVAQQLLYQLCKCLVLAFQVSWRPRLVFKPARAKELFHFGWKLLASGLLDQGYQSLSDLIIGKMFTSADLGYVSQGKRYPQALGVVLDGAIQPVMLSAVSHVQERKDQVKRLARRALKTSTFLIVPAMALFALVAEPLVVLLLGEKWLPCVPFLQMYCFVYALLPIHTTNLQVLNGVGRSDVFLRLELAKKMLGIVVLCFTAFVIRDLYVIVGSYMVTGIICTFINAAPNKSIVGYAYTEQLRDIAPAFLLAFASAALAWPLALLEMPSALLIVAQAAVILVAYALLAKLFRVEAFTYLLSIAREFVGKQSVS